MSEIISSDVVKAIQDGVKTELIIVDEREFTTRQIYAPPSPPKIPTIELQTLTGLLDYIELNPDQLDLSLAFLHVADSETVYLNIGVDDRHHREIPVQSCCSRVNHRKFAFNQWINLQEAIINLQAQFVPTDALDQLLSIIGNLKTEDIHSYADDGVTQTVQTRQGIARAENTDLPPRIELRPYRTFPEIEQPPGDFVFRLRKDDRQGIQCALFEAACSRWQAQAIRDIGDYLRGLTQITVIA